MAITDPIAIKFSNEQIRPLAEAARALKARVTSANVDWQTVQTLVPNSASELIEDGKDAEGINKLSGQDLHDLMYALSVNVGALVDALLAKPCVRPLNVTLPQ